MPIDRMLQFSIRVPAEVLQKLEALAAKDHRSVAAYVRLAIDERMAKDMAPAPAPKATKPAKATKATAPRKRAAAA